MNAQKNSEKEIFEIPKETSILFGRYLLPEQLEILHQSRELAEMFLGRIDLYERYKQYTEEQSAFRYNGVFTLVWAKALTKKENVHEIGPLAVAVDCLCIAGLIHDDLSDNSLTRAGKETFHSRYGVSTAIWYGDFIYSIAYQFLGKTYKTNIKKAEKIISEFNNLSFKAMISLIDDSELQHPSESQKKVPGIEQVIDISAGKNLFTYMPKIVGIFYEFPEPVLSILSDLGKKWYGAIQVISDIRDLKDDVVEGKLTLPILFALENAPSLIREEIVKVYQQNQRNNKDINRVLCFIKQYNGVNKSAERAQELLNETYHLFNSLMLERTRAALILEKYLQLCYDELKIAIAIAENFEKEASD